MTNDINWREYVPQDVTGDPALASIVQGMTEKDLPSVLKSHIHLVRKQGTMLPIPPKDRPDEIAGLKKRLYENGILAAPPDSPQAYEIKRPESLPEGLGWNDDLSNRFASTLHRHGASKELATDLLGLYSEALFGTTDMLKTSYEAGIAALKKEHGAEFEPRQEVAKRLAKAIFKTQEELEFFEKTGMADHPMFLSVIMRLAPLATQDSSFLEPPGGTGTATGDDLRKEIANIMTNKTHPKHSLYWARDPKTLQEIEEMYRKAYGTGKVEIT